MYETDRYEGSLAKTILIPSARVLGQAETGGFVE